MTQEEFVSWQKEPKQFDKPVFFVPVDMSPPRVLQGWIMQVSVAPRFHEGGKAVTFGIETETFPGRTLTVALEEVFLKAEDARPLLYRRLLIWRATLQTELKIAESQARELRNILSVLEHDLEEQRALLAIKALGGVEPDLTCKECKERATCPYVDDPYNTGGDCLALK